MVDVAGADAPQAANATNKGPRVRAETVAEGSAIVGRYMAAGYTVDVGLAQINSANFARLGVTVEQVFKPCTNLQLASSVLQQGYGLATRYYAGLDAISATYSLYNTGTLTRGLRNGYVGRVWMAATKLGSVQAASTMPVAAAVSTGSTPVPQTLPVDRETWAVGPVPAGVVEVFK